MNHIFSLETPVGILTVTDNGEKIVSVRFDGERTVAPVTMLQKETEKQLSEYFDGRRKSFDLPLQLNGTEFQKKVWRVLQTIPYGRTVSYQEIAEKTGDIHACRAVGSAIHANPVPVLIPCHRVIRKDGTPGGYAGGTEKKKILLKLEKENA